MLKKMVQKVKLEIIKIAKDQIPFKNELRKIKSRMKNIKVVLSPIGVSDKDLLICSSNST